MNFDKPITLIAISENGLNFYKNPTYLGDEYYGATRLDRDEIVHIKGEDAFLYDGGPDNLLKEIRSKFTGGNIQVINLKDNSVHNMRIYQDRCLLILRGHKYRDIYSTHLLFEKGVKITSEVTMKWSEEDDAFIISTPYSRCRANRYSIKPPTGESYERIFDALSNGPLTTQEIARKTGTEQHRISGRLSELHASGLVKKCGRKEMENGKHNTLWSLV